MRRYLSFPENGVSYMREEKYLLKIRNIEALPSWTCPTGRALQTDGTIPNGKCTSASVERVFNNGVYLLGYTDASKAQCIDCGKLLSLGSNKPGKQTVHGLKCHLEKCHEDIYTLYMRKFPSTRGCYNFRNGTAGRNDCVSFRILQEYDNLRNGTAERTVIGRNGTLTPP